MTTTSLSIHGEKFDDGDDGMIVPVPEEAPASSLEIIELGENTTTATSDAPDGNQNKLPTHDEKFDDDNGGMVVAVAEEVPASAPKIIDLGQNATPPAVPPDGDRKLLIFYFVVVFGGLILAVVLLEIRTAQEILDGIFSDD